MYSKQLKKIKLIYVGDTKSINLEIIAKSFNLLKKLSINYVLIGNLSEIKNYLHKIKFNKKKIIEVFSIKECLKLSKDALFVFNIGDNKKSKADNIINQIIISNNLAKINQQDLITMPINKSVIKKNISFNGVTEFLAKINDNRTYMLMKGENFSIIPLTTHINLKHVYKFVTEKNIHDSLTEIIQINEKKKLQYNKIIILGVNPHAGEGGTIGKEDIVIKKVIEKKEFKKKSLKLIGPISADSAFNKSQYNNKTLFISLYHDQALIPFKIINKNSVNYTIGLDFNRYSPTHGTAEDIIFKNISQNTSFIECMLN